MNDLTLYQIKDEYVAALQTLNDMGLDEQTVKDSLACLEGDLREKCESVAMWRENQLVIANAKKEAAKRLADQAKAIESRANSMLDYLDTNMKASGITEIACDLFTIKYQKNPPSVSIDDADSIPSEFIKTKVTESIDKVAIKKAIQNGQTVKGASISQGERLVIK